MTARPTFTSSYRLQMNAGFTLADALARVGYFAALGVSHLYLSPILAARTGSMHGYDVVDPARINPELGSEDDVRALAHALHERGMGLIVDIVPNHMGIGPENRYWDDVLTHGEHSRYARWFDIHWARRDTLNRKVVLPILGDELDRVLERRELTIELHGGQPPRVVYFSNSVPLDPASLPPELQLAQTDPEEAGELAAAFSRPENRERFMALLGAQHYRLVAWRQGLAEINYRRFFDVNDLAAVRVEDPSVFDETHALMLRLVADGVVDGLRVDHIDGLLDPLAYLLRLRSRLPDGTLVFVEKILAPGESLRAEWPVDGTTGYEFLNTLDDVFLDPAGVAALDDAYARLRGMRSTTFEETARAGKRKTLTGALRADVGRLAELLAPLAGAAGHRWSHDVLTAALIDFLVVLPVYRTYVGPGAVVHPDDRRAIDSAASAVRGPAGERVAFIAQVLLDAVPGVDARGRLRFAQRLQQVSGPATAKGVEDTALYAYLPLASRNEVGGAPDRPLDDALAALHHENARRAAQWPRALLATNTHDTKRSADVRSRLQVLSEISDEWLGAARRWRDMNARYRREVGGRSAPDLNTEYLLYQTIVALWPASGVTDRAWGDAVRERINEYMLKASREAKTRTNWLVPDESYESGLHEFVAAILDPADATGFLADVRRLAARVAEPGRWNALARIVVHLTSPGVPDLYQGDELWNFVLVDPDNRRRVDYDTRARLVGTLAAVAERAGAGSLDLAADEVKLFVTHRLLELRRNRSEVVSRGTYRRLAVRGPRADHLIAFVRSFGGRHVLAVAPRLSHGVVLSDAASRWQDTAVELPADLVGVRWQSQFVTDSVESADGFLSAGSILSKLPVAVLAD